MIIAENRQPTADQLVAFRKSARDFAFDQENNLYLLKITNF